MKEVNRDKSKKIWWWVR